MIGFLATLHSLEERADGGVWPEYVVGGVLPQVLRYYPPEQNSSTQIYTNRFIRLTIQ